MTRKRRAACIVLGGLEAARKISREQQYKQHQQQDAHAAAGEVTPLAAMTPAGQRPNKQQDDDHQKDQSQKELLSPKSKKPAQPNTSGVQLRRLTH